MTIIWNRCGKWERLHWRFFFGDDNLIWRLNIGVQILTIGYGSQLVSAGTTNWPVICGIVNRPFCGSANSRTHILWVVFSLHCTSHASLPIPPACFFYICFFSILKVKNRNKKVNGPVFSISFLHVWRRKWWKNGGKSLRWGRWMGRGDSENGRVREGVGRQGVTLRGAVEEVAASGIRHTTTATYWYIVLIYIYICNSWILNNMNNNILEVSWGISYMFLCSSYASNPH